MLATGAHTEDRNNVGVSQFRCSAGFTPKPDQVFRFTEQVIRQYFDRNPAAEWFVNSFKNDTHPSAPNFTNDFVIVELCKSSASCRGVWYCMLGLLECLDK